MSIVDDFHEATGKLLTCPLCGCGNFLLPDPGINQQRVVCDNCGHCMWFDTIAGREQDGGATS